MTTIAWQPAIRTSVTATAAKPLPVTHTQPSALQISHQPQFAGHERRLGAAALVLAVGFLVSLLPKTGEQRPLELNHSNANRTIPPSKTETNAGPKEQSFKRISIGGHSLSDEMATLFPAGYKGPVIILNSEPLGQSPEYIPVGTTKEATAQLHQQIAELRSKHQAMYDSPTITFTGKILPDKPPTNVSGEPERWPTKLLLVTGDVTFDSMKSAKP